MRTKNVTRSLLALLAVGATTLVACGSDTASPATTVAPATTAPGTPAASGTIVVFAASSLTEAFKEIGTAFHTANPNATVTFNFAGSSDLVAQIGQGAPADVFASADDSNMKKLVDAGEATGTPKSVATNTFEIIVEKGNPKGIATVADLAKPGMSVVLCAPAVPCGKGAATVLTNAKVVVTPKSLDSGRHQRRVELPDGGHQGGEESFGAGLHRLRRRPAGSGHLGQPRLHEALIRQRS